MLEPIERMLKRVETAREDSDTAFFYDLLLLGELVAKLAVAGLLAGIQEDPERHKYRLLHRLVRADGIGEWATVMTETTVGPASQHLAKQFRVFQRECTKSVGPGEWQEQSVAMLDEVLRLLDTSRDPSPVKVSLLRWFIMFAELRNKTRGHGATKAAACSEACPRLERSVMLFIENFSLFRQPWAYLHRNLSGKYRVATIGGSGEEFKFLSTSATETLRDGVYVFADGMFHVELIHTTVDTLDFYVPNGAFNGQKFELLSYCSDDRTSADASPYLTPVGELPASETEGLSELDTIGNVFANLPSLPDGYVNRPDLERELGNILHANRHDIVTLVGRGGVGKTSLALAVLHQLAMSDRFTAILWFSSRDIDLLPSGPKIVGPNVLSEEDISREFVHLVAPEEASQKGFRATQYLASYLSEGPIGPVLYVFDNFETVRTPRELYAWLDTYVRPPSKILITTRFREFKGDYPVTVAGMSEAECDQLIRQTATQLGISHLLTEDYISDLFREADGHPYVVKVLLGEVAKTGRLEKVERIIAGHDEVLEALFERTYSGLSPAAKRVFLLLCTWRSAIPEIGIEAILLRPANERMDVHGAIDELLRMSLIELHTSADGANFVVVPLAALVFGKRQLAVSHMKAAVEADAQLLFSFGAVRGPDLKRGVGPRVDRFYKTAAAKIARDHTQLAIYKPILEYLARAFPSGWSMLAEIYDEAGDRLEARRALEHFLATVPDAEASINAWERLADLNRQQGDTASELNALVELGQQPGLSYDDVSRAANRVNGLLRSDPRAVDTDEKRILVQKLISAMESRISEASATDLSRLAWLCIHMNNDHKAQGYVQRGLKIEPNNEYLVRLARAEAGTAGRSTSLPRPRQTGPRRANS